MTPAAGGRSGVTVPTLCHHPALPPDGSCRLCAVEIDGRPELHPACVEPAAHGLRVQTDTPATRAARRNALALLLRRYRPRPGTQDNELLALARAHGLSADGAVPLPRAGVDESDPFLPFHFAEAAANELTIGALDPLAKIPEYKVCAVRLERLGTAEGEVHGPGDP